MKVAIIGNDLRAYWKGRLHYLRIFLKTKNIDLYAIELFGKGSPYFFDNVIEEENWWKCLFPQNKSEDLSKQEIKSVLFTELDNITPDVIISSSIVFYSGALGMQWAKKNTRKFIMFDDMKTNQVRRSFLIQTVKNIIISQIDGFWVPTSNYYDDYNYLHDKNVKFIFGLNCIDNSLFKSNSIKSFDHKIIICVGRMVPVKNFPSLFQAWKAVEKEKTGYKLLIIGSGNEFDNLLNLKLDLDLKDLELLGLIDNNDVAEYYYNADAFILASLTESWGLVVNEAMAAGLPVLLSNQINSAESLLKEGKNGYSFSPMNLDEITTAILRFINLSTNDKKAMSEVSINIIEKFSYKEMAAQLYDAIVDITNRPHKSSFLSSIIIKLWYGKNNTAGWNDIRN